MSKSIFDNKNNLLFYRNIYDEDKVYMLYLLNEDQKEKTIKYMQNNLSNIIRIGRAKKYMIYKENVIHLIKDGVIYLNRTENKIYEPTKDQLENYKILYYQCLKEERNKKKKETINKLRKKYEPTIEYITEAKVILDNHIKDSSKTLADLIKCLMDIREKHCVTGIEFNLLDYVKNYKHVGCIKSITHFLTDYIVSKISSDVEHDIISISTPEYENVYIVIEKCNKNSYYVYIDKSLCKKEVYEFSKHVFIIDKTTKKNIVNQIKTELKETFK